MKKIITLLTLIFAISGLSVCSQTLYNTTWAVDYQSTLYGYFHFGTSILSYSPNNTSYSNISTFQTNGNNFSIIDLPGTSPCPTDTGKYTYLIQNDTLKFTLVSDLCPTRPTVFCTYHWVYVVTGIQSVNFLPKITLYPNPTSDEIFIKSNISAQGSTYIISDQLGRQVLTGKLTSETTPVDLRQLPKGIYFFRTGEKSQKIIKK